MVCTFLYGRGLQHLFEVGVVESTLRPKGDLPLHLLKAEKGNKLYETKHFCSLQHRKQISCQDMIET